MSQGLPEVPVVRQDARVVERQALRPRVEVEFGRISRVVSGADRISRPPDVDHAQGVVTWVSFGAE